nr:phage minor capsid protein [Bacillota bacterium]
ERIAESTSKTKEEIKAIYDESETEIFDIPENVLTANGIDPARFKSLSPEMSKMYKAALRSSTKEIVNLTRTTANTSQAAFINSCNVAQMKIMSGAFTFQEAIKNAILAAAEKDIEVIYPSGHITSLDAACRCAVLTGFNQTVIAMQEMRADEFDIDVMEITAHFGARPTHAEWQGQLVSRSGREGYLNLDDIGYGKVDGFMGANCRHDWNLFFEGYSKRLYSDEELERLKNQTVTYDGKEIKAYEATQKQRELERIIKKDKRELVCLDEGIKNSTDEILKEELSKEFEKKAVRLKQHEAKLADFCNQTGLTRDRYREQQFAVKTEQGISAWTKSVNGKAVAIFEKNKLPNYKQAIISDEKIVGYALNKNHSRGKDKAIAFEKYLGYNVDNKDMLIEEIRKGISKNIATERPATEYGQPYEVTMKIKGANGKYATIKSGWQIDNDTTKPRLVTVYIKGK